MTMKGRVLCLDHIVQCVDWGGFLDSKRFELMAYGILAVLQAWVSDDYSKWLLALEDSISCDKLARYLRSMHEEDCPHDFTDLVHFCEGVKVHERSAKDILEERLQEPSKLQLFTKSIYCFLRAFGGMNVFETAYGRIVVAQSRVSVNDKITLVSGGRSLFILSSDKKYFRGGAYVEDLMKKSLLDLPEELKDTWEMVELF
jgi:hypothetical protein